MAKSVKKPLRATLKALKPKVPKPKLLKPKAQPKAKQAARMSARVLPTARAEPTAAVLDRLWGVVLSRRDAAPALSHSARLLSRGTAKVAQKFGEEAVECLIEAVAGNAEALVAESADVLYHLLVMWVSAGVEPAAIWAELERREGVSGIAEKAGRVRKLPTRLAVRTTKIP